jgi:hypothetical protein
MKQETRNKKQETIIKNTVNSLYMKGVMKKNGWSKQQAANKVIEFLTCGKSVSFTDYMAGNV